MTKSERRAPADPQAAQKVIKSPWTKMPDSKVQQQKEKLAKEKEKLEKFKRESTMRNQLKLA